MPISKFQTFKRYNRSLLRLKEIELFFDRIHEKMGHGHGTVLDVKYIGEPPLIEAAFHALGL